MQREVARGGTEIAVNGYSDNDRYEYDNDDNDKISERITPLMALAPSLAISDSSFAKKLVSTAKYLDGIA